MTQSPRILLIGISGVYNYGCEAIVRGTEVILRRAYPNAEIVYASRRPSDDQRRLAGSQVTIIQRPKHNRYSIKNACRKLASFGGVRWQIRIDSLRLLRKVDAVLSIGGDLYTPGPLGDCSLAFPKFGDAARRRGIPYVLWSASVGPFSHDADLENAFRKHLNRLTLITARESTTIDYLASQGIAEKVVPCADPAYVVARDIRADGSRSRERPTIGVNLSPLATRFSARSAEEAIREQARSLESLVQATGATIVLIPHVVCDFDPNDDDLAYLRRLKEAIAPECQDAVVLRHSDGGFVGAKRDLARCDLVIAARMHCAINALAARVPTLLVAYSRKAVGMAQYVYGNGEWVLPIDQFANEQVLIDKVRSMLSQRAGLHTALNARIPQIQQDAFRPLERLTAELAAVWAAESRRGRRAKQLVSEKD